MPHSLKSLSRQLTLDLDKETKKKEGIFFTPSNLAELVLQHTHTYLPENSITEKYHVLEPSCGSGEFIQVIQEQEWWRNKVEITAVEKNGIIVKEITQQPWIEGIHFHHSDFLRLILPHKYHLIVGNPPYFVLKRSEIPESFLPFVEGRPNIFTLFILKSLQLLQPDGIVAFVLPKSFLNCAYYDRVREYLVKYCDVLEIFEPPKIIKFLETAQPTIVLIAKKKSKDNQTSPQQLSEWECRVGSNNRLVFTTHKEELTQLLKGATTLSQAGYRVSVGNVVWNQVKPDLTDDDSEIRLIYSSDIQKGHIIKSQFRNKDKKNYLKESGKKPQQKPYQKPVLLLNRGYGTGKYQFQHAIVGNEITNYLVENHVMVIEKEQAPNYQAIQTSFQNPKTSRFIELFFGNNAVNVQELSDVLPIYFSA